MAVLVGIDEAGFGPILGPLVVSSSTFSLPDNMVEADLWRLLRKGVSITRKHLAGRLLITDSKKAYSRAAGIGHLQRTVLACLSCLDKQPATLTDLLTILCAEFLDRSQSYPWYKNTATYGISADQADIAITAGVLKNCLASSNIELLGLESCCLDVAFYNRMVAAVKNKASVLFSATCRLIKNAYDDFAQDMLRILVDRQGGRVHYRRELLRMFPHTQLRILAESPKVSSYELKDGPRRMRLDFVVGADERFLPVSLASMVSKYLRELLVDNINRYFTAFDADLKPTAGYWKDGLRFIRELQTSPAKVPFDSNQLVRCR